MHVCALDKGNEHGMGKKWIVFVVKCRYLGLVELEFSTVRVIIGISIDIASQKWCCMTKYTLAE